MKNFLFLLVVALVISNITFASHFYYGGSVLLSNLHTKESISSHRPHHLTDIAFTVGALGGYCFCPPCQPYDLGLEVFFNGNGAENAIVHDSNNTLLTTSSRYNLGIRALPGYRFSEAIEGHLIFGYSLGNFGIQDDGVQGVISKKVNINGIQLGAGLNASFSYFFSIRLDGIYTLYGSRSIQGVSNVEGESGVYTIKPSTFDTILSLIFTF